MDRRDWFGRSPQKRDTPAVRTVRVDGYFNSPPHTLPFSVDTPNEEKTITCDRRCAARCVLVRISECNVLQHDGCAIYICTGLQVGGGGSYYNSNSILQVSAIPNLSFSGVIRNGSRDQFSPWGFRTFRTGFFVELHLSARCLLSAPHPF